ncbi:hypothetical protein ACOI1H_13405 [Loktanella sp. DJP18]|uniref:hypothetical protein n=1 Tax=Loktanella sp. DJP18 TaxID=3409788 RepID=UPI003BB7410C
MSTVTQTSAPTTLRALIAGEDFTDYSVENASWRLDADAIESILYDRTVGDWSLGDRHTEAFYKAETMTSVALNSWLCTDQQVGLYLLCLNGTPFALSWQIGRKCDRNVAFLNYETMIFFRTAWEEHRPDQTERQVLVNDAVLDMPLAAPGHKPFELDEQSNVEDVRLSIFGIDDWMKSLAPAGGLGTFYDQDVLASLTRIAEFGISRTEMRIAEIDTRAVTGSLQNQADFTSYRADLVNEKMAWEQEILTPLRMRLDVLRGLPDPTE